MNRVCVAMVNLLAWNAVDSRFKPRSGQTKLLNWYLLLLHLAHTIIYYLPDIVPVRYGFRYYLPNIAPVRYDFSYYLPDIELVWYDFSYYSPDIEYEDGDWLQLKQQTNL